MFRGRKAKGDTSSKIVLVLADCSQGVLNAGTFAVNYLYDDKTRLVLLQTYQPPEFGAKMIRSITPMLKNVAEKELTYLKDKLTSDFSLPGNCIEKLVLEGNLKSVINHEFKDSERISIVLGFGSEENVSKPSCRNILRLLVESGKRPVFLVSESITVLEDSKTLLFAEKEKNISDVYLNLIQYICDEKEIILEIITADNQQKASVTDNTMTHFSKSSVRRIPKSSVEHIFYKNLIEN